MTAKKITRATHEEKLKLGGAEIDVAVLENGQRIITQNGVFKALDRPSRGNSRVIGIPNSGEFLFIYSQKKRGINNPIISSLIIIRRYIVAEN